VLVLEELEHARERGAVIYAEVLGLGTSFDAYAVTKPDPEARGAARAIRWALREARVNADEIDYINAHGTSTRLNDLMETVAVKRVFGPDARRLPLSSIKSMVGHLIGAAGAVEAAAPLVPEVPVAPELPVELDPVEPVVPVVAAGAVAAAGGGVSTLCVPANVSNRIPGGSFVPRSPRIVGQLTSCANTEVTSAFNAAADVPPVCGPCCS